jgi:hypothetical protein
MTDSSDHRSSDPDQTKSWSGGGLVKPNFLAVGTLATALLIPMLLAGIRGPGKYNGVVFYDRWDNCYLFSGVYLMYISEMAKESLRRYQGQSLEIDAKDVYQPANPGDGVIRKFVVLGNSKESDQSPPIRGIQLRATVSNFGRHAIATVEIRDTGPATILIDAHALGFAVIAHDKPLLMCPSDGTSCAVITRVSAIAADGENMVGGQTWGWRIDSNDRLPNRFALRSGGARTISVIFDLPKGAYQFIAGYGGGVHSGPCAASNAVAFDVARK